jgi:hypothetical protein
MGAEARVVVPQLIEALRQKDPAVRGAAVRILASIGPEAARAVSSLRALRDNDPALARDVSDALQKIERP